MKHNRGDKQSGLVSLVVVSIIAVVLALITVGFSRIMDRELRQSLDNDLSTQAFYAAESGMNDARSYLASLLDNGASLPASQACLDTTSSKYQPFFVPVSISSSYSGNPKDDIVKYPCVILDTQPHELVYDVPVGQAKVFETTPAGLANLFFSWENSQVTTKSPLPGACSGTSNCLLPQESALSSANTGVLRVTIYPVYSDSSGHYGANDKNTQIAKESSTFFFYPNNGSGALGTKAFGQTGTFVQGECAATHPNNLLPYSQSRPRYCNSKITSVTTNAGAYYVALTALYHPLSVSIQGSDNTGASLALPGAEAVVDVTGEGNDVLRRIEGLAPYNNNLYPAAALTSLEDVCKVFRIPKIGPNTYDFYGITNDKSNLDPKSTTCNIY